MLATSELHSLAERLKDCTEDLPVGDIYFEGAAVYDAICAQDKSEIVDLLRLARGISTPVLELACGSGRLCVPLLAAGHQVVGVDNAPEMLTLLDKAVTKPEHRARLRTVLGDMSAIELEEEFDLIYCGITSVSLLPDAARRDMLATANRHLTATGRLVFTLLHGDPTTDGVAEDTVVSVVELNGQTDLVVFMERVDHGASTRTVSLLHEPLGPQGERGLYTSELKVPTVDHIVQECLDAGLAVVDVKSKPVGGRTGTEITCARGVQS